MKTPKMANIVYRQMPAPQELLQQIPWAKAPWWGQIFGANPGCARGVGVMFEIDTRITWLRPSHCFRHNFKNRKPNHKAYQQNLNPKCIG